MILNWRTRLIVLTNVMVYLISPFYRNVFWFLHPFFSRTYRLSNCVYLHYLFTIFVIKTKDKNPIYENLKLWVVSRLRKHGFVDKVFFSSWQDLKWQSKFKTLNDFMEIFFVERKIIAISIQYEEFFMCR